MNEQQTAATPAPVEAQTQEIQTKRGEVIVPDMLSMISGARFDERDQLILLRAKFEYAQRMAKLFAVSGCFADVKDTREEVAIAKALVKIKLGESMGFTEAESMTGIDIIQGRVAVGANLRAARMQRAGFSWPQMIVNDKGCWIPLVFQGEPLMQQKVDEEGQTVLVGGKPVMVQVVVSFTMKDAQLAGLAGKDNYKKDPSSMFFARGVTRAQRRYGPGVLGIDILDTYEARDLVTDEPVSGAKESTQAHDARLYQKIHEQGEQARKSAEAEVNTTREEAEKKPDTAETKAPATEDRNEAEERGGLKAQPAPNATKSETGGWPNRAAMMEDFTALFVALGEQASWNILGTYSISEEAELDPAGTSTAAAYRDLQAAVAEKRQATNSEAAKPIFGKKVR
jgi:hypothetical protein